jgi:hypothetical protein
MRGGKECWNASEANHDEDLSNRQVLVSESLLQILPVIGVVGFRCPRRLRPDLLTSHISHQRRGKLLSDIVGGTQCESEATSIREI